MPKALDVIESVSNLLESDIDDLNEADSAGDIYTKFAMSRGGPHAGLGRLAGVIGKLEKSKTPQGKASLATHKEAYEKLKKTVAVVAENEKIRNSKPAHVSADEKNNIKWSDSKGNQHHLKYSPKEGSATLSTNGKPTHKQQFSSGGSGRSQFEHEKLQVKKDRDTNSFRKDHRKLD